MKVRFIVPGKPVPWQRTGKGKRGQRYTQTQSRAYKAHVAIHAMAARPKGWPLDARYSLRVRFYGAHGNTDGSNVLKQIEDACQHGVLWNDDRQIDSTGPSIRCRGGEPRVEVEAAVL